MIYYFSGTGNTRWVAEQVSRACGLALRNVADCLGDVATPEINLWTEGILGLAFPIYGWTIPKVAEAFIRSLPRAEAPGTYYVFALLTCGDDIGRAHERLAMLLAEKGYELSAVWSFSMPNTYIGLPFFDVDNEELAARKIKSTQEKAATRGATDPLSRKRRGRRSARLVFAMEKWMATTILLSLLGGTENVFHPSSLHGL